MNLGEIAKILNAEFICGEEEGSKEIQSAGGSDLMSDVLAFGKPGLLLLTGLSNIQTVRTADIIEAKAIIYVRGKRPDDDGIRLAREKGIPLLTTKMMMYQACGLLYTSGLAGVYMKDDIK